MRLARFFIYRKIQVDIVSIFLTLMLATTLFIVVFTYKKNYNAILDFSQMTISRASQRILIRTQDLIEEIERVALVAKGGMLGPDRISSNDQELTRFLLNLVNVNSMLDGIYVGDEQGDFIGAFSLAALQQVNYQSEPSKPLPPGSKYCLRIITQNAGKSIEKWYYKNNDLATLGEETITSVNYDPRTRPWYLDAQKAGQLSWTDVYQYAITNEMGITASIPVAGADKKMYAVVGVDLSLKFLSKFIADEKIGRTGKAFVLDGAGTIMVPNDIPSSEKSVRDALAQAFAHYSIAQHADFMQKTDGVEYLIYLSKFPITSHQQWLIVTIVPFNDFFAETLEAQKQAAYVSLLILVLSGILIYFSSKHIADPIVTLSDEIDKVRNLDFSSDVRIRSNIKEIHILDLSIMAMRVALRTFGRYVPKDVVKELLQRNQEIALGGEEKEITILFSDISAFTTIAETLPVEVLVSLLSEYFDVVSKTILEADGTIDKYIGDSVMSFWNAPQEVADHATKACLTALRCKSRLADLNKKRKEQGFPEFETRFGIHTGHVIVGNIGTSERMNYTVIGDSVNIASRLQSIDKEYHTSILISEAVVKELKGDFVMRPLDEVLVKGKRIKVKIYELIGLRQGEKGLIASSSDIALCEAFTEAYTSFSEGKLAEAKAQFEAISKRFPDDFPTKIYLDRLAAAAT